MPGPRDNARRRRRDNVDRPAGRPPEGAADDGVVCCGMGWRGIGWALAAGAAIAGTAYYLLNHGSPFAAIQPAEDPGPDPTALPTIAGTNNEAIRAFGDGFAVGAADWLNGEFLAAELAEQAWVPVDGIRLDPMNAALLARRHAIHNGLPANRPLWEPPGAAGVAWREARQRFGDEAWFEPGAIDHLPINGYRAHDGAPIALFNPVGLPVGREAELVYQARGAHPDGFGLVINRPGNDFGVHLPHPYDPGAMAGLHNLRVPWRAQQAAFGGHLPGAGEHDIWELLADDLQRIQDEVAGRRAAEDAAVGPAVHRI